MGLAQYQILPQGDEWGVLHDGDVRNRYRRGSSSRVSLLMDTSGLIRIKPRTGPQFLVGTKSV